MNSKEVRQKFLDFFESKKHKIVDSAPIVVKDDPTLMFTNAGMNQFKDYFLGNKSAENKRVSNLQKCLRVSGKHNDLEEVGVDHYHHTMFEMMGNWSFGDYFKKEAIDWAWELLTEVYQLDKENLYITVFEGNDEWGVPLDTEAIEHWKKYLPEERILKCDAKDNFWEMGDTGPCGPCSEIHVDMRSEEDKAKIPGVQLVNEDDPEVIEIWNLVFIQFNRKKDQSLEPLKDKHIDTGMGFERIVRVLQKKKSNYDTDIFTPLIAKLEEISNIKYEGTDSKKDIAFRVIADHIRTIAFTITDGQLPSNTGAGYVIRRVLRRAVRYAYSFLDVKKPFLAEMLEALCNQFDGVYPELDKNKALTSKVISEEEKSFLKTLESGLKRYQLIKDDVKSQSKNQIEGAKAFELYDTYGFPIDLTRLMAEEDGIKIDEEGFKTALNEQKERARAATKIDAGDWIIVNEDTSVEFVGYDETETETSILRYRTVKTKDKETVQIVLKQTPFYAESGGQVGDKGVLIFVGDEKIKVIDTQKENDLIVHYCDKIPSDPSAKLKALIAKTRREDIKKNHTATHLIHAALRDILGTHVEQKGSLVAPDYLRFDFSHFSKMEEEEIRKVEIMVNEKIIENISLHEDREANIEDAKAKGAMALFGEKYGDKVRVITFDPDFSVELCGGTHVQATGEIGFCKLTLETSVASGIRRIEAITGKKAMEFILNQNQQLAQIKNSIKASGDLVKGVDKLVLDNSNLRKEVEHLKMQQAGQLKMQIENSLTEINGVSFSTARIDGGADVMKKIAHDLKQQHQNLFLVLASQSDNKVQVSIAIGEQLIQEKQWNAGQLIREWAKHINGGGGGQPFFATAGGKKPEGIDSVFSEAEKFVKS